MPSLFFIPLRIPAWLVLGGWFVLQWAYAAGWGACGDAAVTGLLVRLGSPPPRYPGHPRYQAG